MDIYNTWETDIPPRTFGPIIQYQYKNHREYIIKLTFWYKWKNKGLLF